MMVALTVTRGVSKWRLFPSRDSIGDASAEGGDMVNGVRASMGRRVRRGRGFGLRVHWKVRRGERLGALGSCRNGFELARARGLIDTDEHVRRATVLGCDLGGGTMVLERK